MFAKLNTAGKNILISLCYMRTFGINCVQLLHKLYNVTAFAF